MSCSILTTLNIYGVLTIKYSDYQRLALAISNIYKLLMKTIICGSGDVGYSIADKLSKENFEVTVVDEASDKLNKISENLDVKVVSGSPSLPSVLLNAGAKDCDILIAVTRSDETNMIVCQIGYSLFNIPTKIARIRQQDYLKVEWSNLYNKENLPIASIISPEL